VSGWRSTAPDEGGAPESAFQTPAARIGSPAVEADRFRADVLAFIPACRFVLCSRNRTENWIRLFLIALLAIGERRLIRPPERYAGDDDTGGLDMHLALALIVARIDEVDWAFHHLQQRHVRRRTDL
jgi:hypothetical protein